MASCALQGSTALSVSSGSATPGTTVALSIALNGTGTAPTGLQWTLKYATADITSATIAASAASTSAGKQITCTSSAGSSMCMVWGINSTAISNGVVATVTLAISATTKNTSSSIQLLNGVAAASNGVAIAVSSTGGTLSIPQSPPISLLPYNRTGIATDGTTFTGGLDNAGNAYSANLLGSTVSANGASFTLGTPNVANTITSTTVTLPAGQFAGLALLATAVNGTQLSQTFTVTFTDGSTDKFTQSLSDWHTSKNYVGEKIAATMAYYDTSTGGKTSLTSYLYAYAFTITGSKTVQSLTLPSNSNVVVLAVAMMSTTPTTGFGLSTTPASQTVPAGTSTNYTVTASGYDGFTGTLALSESGLPTGASATFTPATLSGSGSSTVKISTLSTTPAGTYTVTIIATSGSLQNSNQITLVVNQMSSQVSLTTAYNEIGIVADGTTFASGLDSTGQAYSSNLLGSSMTVNGTMFTLGPANSPDVVTSTAVVLPAAEYSTLAVLGTAVGGIQLSQVFIVTYSDGTTTSFTQSVSDWQIPENYSGETQALKMSYADVTTGTKRGEALYLYSYAFALTKTKTVKSVTLPNNAHVVVLALTLLP